MKKIVLLFVVVLLFSDTAYSASIILKRGTEVLVRPAEKMKSNKVKSGQTIRFIVERAVKNENGFTLIERGAFAYGKVTKASSAGMLGAKGSLSFSIDSVEAFNGQSIPLTGHLDTDGSSSTGVVVASAVLLTPLALLFRGSNAVIDPRTTYPVYVAETTVLEGDFLGLPGDVSPSSYQQPQYPQQSYQQPQYQQSSYPQQPQSYPQSSYSQPSYPQQSYEQQQYQQSSYPQQPQSYPQSSYSQTSYPQQSYEQQQYQQSSYPQQPQSSQSYSQSSPSSSSDGKDMTSMLENYNKKKASRKKRK